MNRDNYISIQGWMRTELNLKGNDLLVYAIIYGYSQSDNNKYTGSLQYLADWCGATKQGIQKNLKNLLDKGLIIKEAIVVNNIKMVSYYTTKLHTIQLSCINNTSISINTNTNISNNTNTINSNTSKQVKDLKYNYKENKNNGFLGSAKKEAKKSLYDKCADLINIFSEENNCNEEEKSLLFEYLGMILNIHKETEKPFYTNNFKGKLNQLKKLLRNDWKQILRNTLENGWLGFYPLKETKNVFNESRSASNTQFTENDRIEQEKFLKEMEKNGKRTKF